MIKYDNEFTIYSRLNITYKYLLNTHIDEYIDEEIFLLANPFTGTNIDHDLSIILNRIHIYRLHNLTMPIVLTEFSKAIPRNIEICRLLLPNSKIYFLPDNKIVKFRKLHITENIIFDIMKHRYLINEIIEKTIDLPLIRNNFDNYKDKK
jgi:hypothetical protein